MRIRPIELVIDRIWSTDFDFGFFFFHTIDLLESIIFFGLLKPHFFVVHVSQAAAEYVCDFFWIQLADKLFDLKHEAIKNALNLQTLH